MEKANPIQQLDREKAKFVVEGLEDILKPLAEDLGGALSVRKFSFWATNDCFQIKVSLLDSKGEVITDEMEAFKSHGLRYCLLLMI